MQANNPFSLYIHLPFCLTRCSYCDFNTYTGVSHLIPQYTDAICEEIKCLGVSGKVLTSLKPNIHTIYFGGGTPSLFKHQLLKNILDTIYLYFEVIDTAEITLEVNPGSIDPSYMESIHSIGINRLSLGMQSSHPDELHLLSRQHTQQAVEVSMHSARQSGFKNISLDLIYGIPKQSLPSWQLSLNTAIVLQPEHLSLYSLTIEPGTPLHYDVSAGIVSPPDDDLSADMYELADTILVNAGYFQYEISNWARKNEDDELLTSRHNIQYWHNQPYLGLGAGAHGYANKIRTENVSHIQDYIQNMQTGSIQNFPISPATTKSSSISMTLEMQETMMMGLRLTDEGISRQVFLERFGYSPEDVFGKEIDELLQLELLEWRPPQKDALRLTKQGRLLGNQVFMRFVGDV
jgi:oxygen-independent coproporphyrinogen III oxidase